ncbi:hypothetical protein FACS1894147_11520 [Spirochaetia bacterium]|nr:hypothetical protein FACS1894147_11520 [Spirochaetia bacterium]
MGTTYRTEDGRTFTSEYDAQGHANRLAADSAKHAAEVSAFNQRNRERWAKSQEAEKLREQGEYDQAIQLNSELIVENYEYYNIGIAHLNRGRSYSDKGDYDRAMEDLDKAIEIWNVKVRDGSSSSDRVQWLPHAHYFRGEAYRLKGNTEQAIADYKMAADFWTPKTETQHALTALTKLGVNYTPMPRPTIKPGSDSTTGSRGTTGRSSGGFGFIGRTVCGVIGAVIFGSIAGFFRSDLVNTIAPLAGFVIAFHIMALAGKKRMNLVVKLVIAVVLGLVITIGRGGLPSLKSQIPFLNSIPAAATQSASTATVTSDALNLRAEPSASGALLKTLKKGDTLTVTGDAANGWTPVEHDGAKGYVSAQYIKIK